MISVTNNTNTITVDDGNSITHIPKDKVTVFDYKDIVYIFWDGHIQIKENYANFSAPSGASAAVVADAIRVFLDSGGSLGGSSFSYTIGVPGVTGVDYNFTSVANMLEQSIQLGLVNIIPADSIVLAIRVKCTASITSSAGAVTANCDVGNTSGGDEWISVIDMSDGNDIQSVGTQVSAMATASSIYFSITPTRNWNTLTAGKWEITIYTLT